MRLIDSDKLHYKEIKCANNKTIKAVTERDIQSTRAVVEHGKWIRHKGRNEQCSVCKRYFPLWMLESKFDITHCPLCGSYLDR